MTILPGQPIAPPDQPSSPPPSKHSRGPRMSLSGRTLAVVLAGVVAAGGGAWFVLHSSGSKTPAAVTHHVVRHPKPTAGAGTLAAPHTKAQAMTVATRVFATLPAQLPGWQVDGKPTFDTSGHNNDPLSKAFNKCLGGATTDGIGVDSASVFHRTPAPTYESVDVTLDFVRTPAQATADLTLLRRPATRSCIAKILVGRTIPIAGSGSMKITSMRPQPMPGRAIAWQFDGRLDSSNTGPLPLRIVLLATVDRATEILVASVGFGDALPFGTDVKVVNAVVAQTHRVIA